MSPINVVCVKWGTKYSSEYVNNLFSMVSRNLTVPFRFVCLTEDSSGVNKDIETLPFLDNSLVGWWNKIPLHAPKIHDLEGTILYMDLDMIILDNIDCFATIEGDFFTAIKWRFPDTLNSTLMRFDIGKNVDIYDEFIKNKKQLLNMSNVYGQAYNDQDWIDAKRRNVASRWPNDWYCSYQLHCYNKKTKQYKVPEGVKIVAFHGKTNPHTADPSLLKFWR